MDTQSAECAAPSELDSDNFLYAPYMSMQWSTCVQTLSPINTIRLIANGYEGTYFKSWHKSFRNISILLKWWKAHNNIFLIIKIVFYTVLIIIKRTTFIFVDFGTDLRIFFVRFPVQYYDGKEKCKDNNFPTYCFKLPVITFFFLLNVILVNSN